MKTVEIQVRNPEALWHEIKKLINVHCGVSEDTSFMKKYPEVYHIYLQLDSDEQLIKRGGTGEF